MIRMRMVITMFRTASRIMLVLMLVLMLDSCVGKRITKANVGQRKVFYHCASGNRCGATLIPYLMLDQEFTEEEAVNAAMRMGTRSAELIEWALQYVRKQADA